MNTTLTPTHHISARRRTAILSALLAIALLLAFFLPLQAVFAQQPVVHAVLFYSPTCEHCHKVMNEDLPPLVAKYPGQLDIVGVDVTHAVGSNIYQAALSAFNVPDDRVGVPTLIVGTTVLVGSYEIPAKLPDIVAQGLASGGVDWPKIPGLQTVLLTAGRAAPLASSEPAAQATTGNPGFVDKFMQDPLANTIAVVVLVLMIVCLYLSTRAFLRGSRAKFVKFPGWVVPLLALLGIFVALYLSYIELFQAPAICGPVGHCNSVQQSPYAWLFGIIPVGVLGVLGYIAILFFSLLKAVLPKGPARIALATCIWVMAWFGVAFSIYLTFLEPFVIGATCIWCITSAILMTLILLGATQPALESMSIPVDDDDDEDDDDDLAEQPVVQS